MNLTKVAIIGGGPSGMATALQLKRFKMDSYLFEKDRCSGLIRNANQVENYLGFKEKMSGLELLNLFQEHL